MNRLEEIKKKHEESIKDGEFRIFAPDIEYLLNEVERYKNVLRALDSVLHFDRKIEEPNAQPFTTGTEVMFHQEHLDRIRAYNIVFKMAEESLKER